MSIATQEIQLAGVLEVTFRGDSRTLSEILAHPAHHDDEDTIGNQWASTPEDDVLVARQFSGGEMMGPSDLTPLKIARQV